LHKTATPALDITLPAVPGAASDARRAVHELAAGRVGDGYAVALAVSEAVSNVVIHAYRDRDHASEPGEVRVTVTIDGEQLVVSVADEGIGMRPRSDSPGAGLGLPIIATLADRFEVRQQPGGTTLVLGFRLAPAD
jgi:anti-sigma regulatory factor (Ser/Thr protein kinase)